MEAASWQRTSFTLLVFDEVLVDCFHLPGTAKEKHSCCALAKAHHRPHQIRLVATVLNRAGWTVFDMQRSL
jgi:hypothetical protein